MRQPEKWQAGEEYEREMYDSRTKQHFDVPDGNGVVGSGGRFPDAIKILADGKILAIKVKTYGMWRMVSGRPQMMTVPLSDDIRDQVQKDAWLKNNLPGYDPRWIFLHAPPTIELMALLNNFSIITIVHH